MKKSNSIMQSFHNSLKESIPIVVDNMLLASFVLVLIAVFAVLIVLFIKVAVAVKNNIGAILDTMLCFSYVKLVAIVVVLALTAVMLLKLKGYLDSNVYRFHS